jgi:hypothetical protein
VTNKLVSSVLKWGGKLFFQRQIQVPENHKILIMSGSDEPPIIRDENFSGKTESAFQLVIVKNLRQDEFRSFQSSAYPSSKSTPQTSAI